MVQLVQLLINYIKCQQSVRWHIHGFKCFHLNIEAFKAYAKVYPNNATFLVDTYNVLKSGVPNAIKVVKEVLWPQGIKKCAIRIDSGDLGYLSKEARKMLDKAGLDDCKIVASNALDEYLITELVHSDAKLIVLELGGND